MESQLQLLKAQVDNAKTPTQGGGGTQNKKKCFICGKEDHLKPDCPENPKNKGKDGDDKKLGGDGATKQTHWKVTPPTASELSWIKTVNQKTYYCLVHSSSLTR